MDILDFLARVAVIGFVAVVVVFIGRYLVAERGDYMTNDEANYWPIDD